MLELYGVPAPQRDSLGQLARESRQKGWWHAYSDAVEVIAAGTVDGGPGAVDL